jgi:hypothetical protein
VNCFYSLLEYHNFEPEDGGSSIMQKSMYLYETTRHNPKDNIFQIKIRLNVFAVEPIISNLIQIRSNFGDVKHRTGREA